MSTYSSHKQLQEAIIEELFIGYNCDYPPHNLETIGVSRFSTNIYFVANGRIQKIKTRQSLTYINEQDLKRLVREMYNIIKTEL